jgi:hypothetical protein
MLKNFKTEIKWAFIFVLMMLCWMILERILGLHGPHIDKHPIFTNFVAIPAIAIYVLALIDKRNNHFGGSMTYKQGFISGLIITLIVTILSPLTQVVTSKIITPEFFQNAISNAVATGKMEQVAAEKNFSLGSYIIQGLIGAPVMGIITSAIVAIFTRRKAQV